MGLGVAPFFPRSLGVRFGASSGAVFNVGLPLLKGVALEDLLPPGKAEGRRGCFEIVEGDGWLAGFASVPVCKGLAWATQESYRDLIEVTKGYHLCRVWNVVPEINQAGSDGLENYRTFCLERSLLLENALGPEFKRFLPAASAVGGWGNLEVSFVATKDFPSHLENPLQTPAYLYPPRYGPRPPSFARATSCKVGQARMVFVSGTASIIGSESVGIGNLSEQILVTVENLKRVRAAAGLAADGPTSDSLGHYRVYVRRSEDLVKIEEGLVQLFLGSRDQVSFVKADICREELLLEIEGCLFLPK